MLREGRQRTWQNWGQFLKSIQYWSDTLKLLKPLPEVKEGRVNSVACALKFLLVENRVSLSKQDTKAGKFPTAMLICTPLRCELNLQERSLSLDYKSTVTAASKGLSVPTVTLALPEDDFVAHCSLTASHMLSQEMPCSLEADRSC